MDRHEDVLPRVAAALASAQRILCVMHAGPDGDACGSTLGLALALTEMGKDVTLFCHTDVPYNFKFLPGLERLVHAAPPDVVFDATTVCDVGASNRIGPGLPARSRLGCFLNIDHHLTSDDFGDVNYVDANAASVGVMIHRILKQMGHPEPTPGSGDPWSLSFRSRGRVNVARVAQSFGGGGHHNAAGARIAGRLDEVQRKVAAAVRDEYAQALATETG
jgi:nanoRNase/pAp phosphatase (c-di-AMP/oligoRNAs hydrolase)